MASFVPTIFVMHNMYVPDYFLSLRAIVSIPGWFYYISDLNDIEIELSFITRSIGKLSSVSEKEEFQIS